MFYEPIWEYHGHKLVKRPDSDNYYITWCRPGTGRLRRRSTKTSDLDLAKQRLVRFVRDRIHTGPEPIDHVRILDLLGPYVERVVRRSGGYPEKQALKRWTEFLDAHDIVMLAELTRPAQEEYVEWRRRSIRARGFEASNGTLSRELRVMRAALNDAWKERLIDQPPRIISVGDSLPRQRFLFPEEVDRLIAECETMHLYRFVMIALHTLQRPGAILGLKKSQVDLRLGRIDFLPEGQRQSRKRKPVVPITGTLRPILMDAMVESISGHLIEWDRKPVVRIARAFRKAAARAGLEDVTPYTLRHTGATLLLANGVSIRQVAGMMGHTEQQTTELYGKHHVDFLGEARDTLDGLFKPRPFDEPNGVSPDDGAGLTLIPGATESDHGESDPPDFPDQAERSLHHSWTPRIV